MYNKKYLVISVRVLSWSKIMAQREPSKVITLKVPERVFVKAEDVASETLSSTQEVIRGLLQMFADRVISVKEISSHLASKKDK